MAATHLAAKVGQVFLHGGDVGHPGWRAAWGSAWRAGSLSGPELNFFKYFSVASLQTSLEREIWMGCWCPPPGQGSCWSCFWKMDTSPVISRPSLTFGLKWIFVVQTCLFLCRPYLDAGSCCQALCRAESLSSLSFPGKALPSPSLSFASWGFSSNPAWEGSPPAFPFARSPKLTWQHPLPFLYPCRFEQFPPMVPGVKSTTCCKWRLDMIQGMCRQITCCQNWSWKASALLSSPFSPFRCSLTPLVSPERPSHSLVAARSSREVLPSQNHHAPQYCLFP